MNPRELIKYARVWGWTRDDIIVAAHTLLTEVAGDDQVLKSTCVICGGDRVLFGKPCTACG